MAFALYTSSFSDRETIPKVYTCDGEDLSPKLTWRGEPHGTSNFTLAMHDLMRPMETIRIGSSQTSRQQSPISRKGLSLALQVSIMLTASAGWAMYYARR